MNNYLSIDGLVFTGSPRFSPERRQPRIDLGGGTIGKFASDPGAAIQGAWEGFKEDLGLQDPFGGEAKAQGDEYSEESAAYFTQLAEIAAAQWKIYQQYYEPMLALQMSQAQRDDLTAQELQTLGADIRGDEFERLREAARLTPEQLTRIRGEARAGAISPAWTA